MANGKTIGARFGDDETAWLEQRAKALGLKGAGAAVAHIVRAAIEADAHPVLKALPKAPPSAPPPQTGRSGKAKASAVVKAPGLKVTPHTETPPPVDRARVSLIDLPVGRPRPAYGSLAKGPKKGR